MSLCCEIWAIVGNSGQPWMEFIGRESVMALEAHLGGEVVKERRNMALQPWLRLSSRGEACKENVW
jgi:hypothetical protein